MATCSGLYPVSSNADAIQLNIENANRFHEILNGDTITEVETCEGHGPVPTVSKALADAAAYKVPVAWVQGNVETELLQPRIFNDFVYVPLTVPAAMDASPDPSLWRLYVSDITFSDLERATVAVSAGETVVTTPFTYAPGTGDLSVYINGIYQHGGYTESSTTTVTFDEDLPDGSVAFVRLSTNPINAINAYTTAYNATNIGDYLDALNSSQLTHNAEALNVFLDNLDATEVAYGGGTVQSALDTLSSEASFPSISQETALVETQASDINFSGTGITATSDGDATVTVTFDQTAITIQESQINDGGVLARLAGNESITGLWQVSNAAPTFGFFETDAAIDNGFWDIGVSGEVFQARVGNDTGDTFVNWLEVNRTGNVIDSIDFLSSAFSVSGSATFSNNVTKLSAASPELRFIETDATADNGIWNIQTEGEQLRARVINDALSVANNWLEVNRTGTTIDSVAFPNGNFGFGTTDIEAWVGSVKALQIEAGAAVWGTNNGSAILSANVYSGGGGDTYIATNPAVLYLQNISGEHTFRVAASGTIDTAITWTDALTIANDANLVIGGSTVSRDIDTGKLVISGGSTGTAGANIEMFGESHASLAARMFIDSADVTFRSEDAANTYGKFDGNSTAGNTRLLIYDVDNGALERVSVGAADSGGTGFKVLRIPN